MARLLERHRQVEAFDPGDAAIAQRSLVSWRTRWSCDLEVWAWAVGQLAPSTFPPAPAGGLAHLGPRRLPRMRYLADDEVTAAAATQGSVRRCRTRADNSTYIERGLAPPTAICHARTPGRRLARARCVCARALSPAPRQRCGADLHGQTVRLSRPAEPPNAHSPHAPTPPPPLPPPVAPCWSSRGRLGRRRGGRTFFSPRSARRPGCRAAAPPAAPRRTTLGSCSPHPASTGGGAARPT